MTPHPMPGWLSYNGLKAGDSQSEVHVWRAPLDLGADRVQSLRALLTAEERARAMAFRRHSDHEHFVAARGWLRWLLGRYLGQPPDGLRILDAGGGKPALADGASHGLRFNVSHSKGLALVAVSWEREVGVDVEHIRGDFPGLDVARRFFSRAEVAALEALPPASRSRAFFECWTRKEAYLKARGVGLALPLDRFEVSFGPDRAPALRSAGGGRSAPGPDEAELRRWSLHALDAGPGYVASLVVEARASVIRCATCDPAWLSDAHVLPPRLGPC